MIGQGKRDTSRAATPGLWRVVCGPRVGVLLLTVSLCGCEARVGGSGGSYINENDKLRRENLALTEKVAQLEEAIAQRDSEIAALKQRLGDKPKAVAGVKPGDLPAVASLRFDRFTGAFDTDADGSDDTLRLYVQTLDSKGRFMLAIGRAVVQVVSIVPGKQPQKLIEKTIEPAAFDDAYREGLTGTHYTFEFELPQPLPEGAKDLTVKLTFTDAATGATLTRDKSVSVKTQ